VYHAWRPNLPDEADNHLLELAVAAQADAIVTRNLRDPMVFRAGAARCLCLVELNPVRPVS
jgi:predicted nucleic acid-binding protein